MAYSYQSLLNTHSGRFDSLYVHDGTAYRDLGAQALSHSSKITQLEQHIVTPTAIKFSGSSHVEFPSGRGNLLDLTHDWSIAVNTDEIPSVPSDNRKLALFGSGGTSILLQRNAPPSGVGHQWGTYNTSAHDLHHADKRWNDNATGASPIAGGRLLWVYTASTKKMAYYISEAVGSYDLRADVDVPQSAIDGQTLTTGVALSKPWNGPGGITKDGFGWVGTCSEWVLSEYAWSTTEIAEFFDTPSHEVHTLSFYNKIGSWIKPGTYPALVDLKGTLDGGELLKGVPSDFVKK